eukprot:TRINITY_DN1042_c0_g1_i1.p1 TRINITY_DN1042_c0_g1~~TRINITY_DN1042_c0_g1_i1.p1  ORF type:complete len:545 (-),score=116.44 TRINITY_DN1042_c0_g1_i1:212-1702(-)
MNAVMMPPSLEQKAKILKMQFYRFKDLPVMDHNVISFGEKCDPYVKVQFSGQSLRSKVFAGQNIDNVDSELQIPVMEPTMSKAITVSLYDRDNPLDQDDLISTFRVDYADIKDHPEWHAKPRWHIMYGAPEEKGATEIKLKGDSKCANKMNRGYIEGSYFRGSVLMSAKVEEPAEKNLDPELENIKIEHTNGPDFVNFCVRCDVYEGTEMASIGSLLGMGKSKKFRVEVHLGRQGASTEPCVVVGGRCKWYQICRDVNAGFCENQDIDLDVEPDAVDDAYKQRFSQIPDVFVYLAYGKDINKSHRFSYKRFPMWKLIKNCRESNYKVPPKWHILQECKALDMLDDSEFPGSILLSIRADRTDRMQKLDLADGRQFSTRPLLQSNIEPQDIGASDQEVKVDIQKPKIIPTFGNLTIHIIEAKNLPIMDSTSSDPYCKIKVNNEKFKTDKKKSDLNPKWGETFRFNDSVHVNDTVLIDVYDYDMGPNRDDIMGTISSL